jgi:hypothetical protein
VDREILEEARKKVQAYIGNEEIPNDRRKIPETSKQGRSVVT